MNIGEASRRQFLLGSVSGLSSAWLALRWPAILAAQEHAQRAEASGRPAQFQFFSLEEAVEVEAIAGSSRSNRPKQEYRRRTGYAFQKAIEASVFSVGPPSLSRFFCSREDSIPTLGRFPYLHKILYSHNSVREHIKRIVPRTRRVPDLRAFSVSGVFGV